MLLFCCRVVLLLFCCFSILLLCGCCCHVVLCSVVLLLYCFVAALLCCCVVLYCCCFIVVLCWCVMLLLWKRGFNFSIIAKQKSISSKQFWSKSFYIGNYYYDLTCKISGVCDLTTLTLTGLLNGYNFIQFHLISFNFFKKQYAHSRTRYAFSNQIETKQEIENINKESQTKKDRQIR